MHKKQRQLSVITWKRFSHRRFSAFASLGRQIRIGVLTVAVLGSATRAVATEVSTHERPEAAEDTTAQCLDGVTVTGSTAPLPALEQARIVSVITRDEIQAAAVSRPADLFKLSSGVDVRQRGGFGIQTDISIDGGTYEQATLLLNGIPINNPHTGHLAADFPCAVSDIERIEILEGASARVYGGQAFGGAINIVTRRDTQPCAEADLSAGHHGTVMGEARLTVHPLLHLSGGGGRSDGGTINDAWKRGQLFAQGDYHGRDLDLTYQAGFSRKSYGANTFYSGLSDDQWEQNTRYILSISGETKGRVHLLPSAYWQRTIDRYEWHHGTPNNFHQANVYGLRLAAYTHWALGRTALSAEMRNEGILSTSLGHEMEKDGRYTRRDNRTLVSYTLEHNIVLRRWTISAGLLANMTTSVDHRMRLYPGIDIAYRPSAQWKLYLGYNKGFRLPTFTDLYYSSPDITGNERLRPEVNRSLTLGASFTSAWVDLSLRGFYNRGRHMIDYVKTAFGDAAHADNFTLDNLGLTASAALRLRSWATLRLGYTYIYQHRAGRYPIFTSLYADDYLRHKLTASLQHKIYGPVSASWSVRYQRRMGQYQVYDHLTPTARLHSYSPYATLDLRLNYQVCRPLAVYIEARNLTDCRYQDLGNIPQPGLWIMAGVRVNVNIRK